MVMPWTEKHSLVAEDHLEALASEWGVEFSWCSDWRDGEAFPAQLRIVIPRVRRPIDYMIGLHELGHCLHERARKTARARGLDGIIECEAAAWSWAAHYCDTQLAHAITETQWVWIMGQTLGSYIAQGCTLEPE